MTSTREVEVPPERLAGWVERFGASHGGVTASVGRGEPSATVPWQLRAEDGSWARLTGWRDAVEGVSLGEWAAPPPLLVLLVRRGGYAVALVSRDGDLLAHKVGTRHVQSRTAAGGWSQQRYARRRGHQADALVEAVVGHARRLLEASDVIPGQGGVTVGGLVLGGLLLGGDRTLAADVLTGVAREPWAWMSELPVRELWDLPDPRRAVLDEAISRGRAVRVTVHNA